MSTSPVRIDPLAVSVSFTDDGNLLKVQLTDAREIAVPVAWFPRLADATKEQRSEYRLVGGGIGIHWPSVDEDLSVAGLLRGDH